MTARFEAVPAVPVRYDPDDPELRTDPYLIYARLREQGPQQDRLGVWILSRYSDVAAVLRSRHFTSDPYAWDLYPELAEAIYEDLECPLLVLQRTWLMLRDGEEHQAARRLFARALTAERVQHAAAYAGQVAYDHAAELTARGGGDFMSDVAVHVPVRTICHLLAMPYEDGVHCRGLMDKVLLTFGLSGTAAQTVREANEAAVELLGYFSEMVERRRALPGEDLVSELLRTDADAMTLPEWVANVILLFAAGHETTVNVLGNGMLALLRHPDQLDLLRREPGLAAGAVDEMLRYDSPMQVVSRSALADTMAGAQPVQAGQHVALLLGSSNRDPGQFEQPDVFDIRRPAGTGHLSFGAGAHFCLGARLARSEASAAFAAVVRALPDQVGQGGTLAWVDTTSHRGLKHLPLELNGTAR
ncbi:cytochrome P450 [Nonomuraea sp. NPDC050556]|uniref:cytochrome P450 n=1 Tax=Nonomuraea sp. NPDC050556 TaxID=3364369 RepID=UPI00378D6041